MAAAEPPPPPDATPGPRPLDSIRCSFCGKRGTEVDRIIAGPTPAVAICSECVGLCSEMVAEERAGDEPPDPAA
jgi:ATP-dependent Clp protease ATP-binding subunit ClpX